MTLPFLSFELSPPVFWFAKPIRHFSCAAIAARVGAHVRVAAGRPAVRVPSPFDVSVSKK